MNPSSYRVIVTRDATESVAVCVLATSPAEADERALLIARMGNPIMKWELDEGNSHDPYIGAPGEAEEVRPLS
jgi:hypothetical protein